MEIGIFDPKIQQNNSMEFHKLLIKIELKHWVKHDGNIPTLSTNKVKLNQTRTAVFLSITKNTYKGCLTKKHHKFALSNVSNQPLFHYDVWSILRLKRQCQN